MPVTSYVCVYAYSRVECALLKRLWVRFSVSFQSPLNRTKKHFHPHKHYLNTHLSFWKHTPQGQHVKGSNELLLCHLFEHVSFSVALSIHCVSMLVWLQLRHTLLLCLSFVINCCLSYLNIFLSSHALLLTVWLKQMIGIHDSFFYYYFHLFLFLLPNSTEVIVSQSNHTVCTILTYESFLH